MDSERRALKPKTRRIGREAWLLIYVPIYLALFYLVEHVITDNYWVSYCPLDDKIPFVRQFVFIYVLWYPLMAGMALWLLRRDRRAFLRYGWSVAAGLTLSIAIFFIWPSGQNLRPAALPENDLASVLLRAIYAADTNTNVLPSMHVVGTLAAVRAAFEPKCFDKKLPRWAVAALGLMINASTVLVKQHSLLDLLAGLALYLLIYPFIYVLPDKLLRRKA